MQIPKILSRGKIKYLTDEGKAQTLVRTGEGTTIGLTAKEDRKLSDLASYWQYYKGEGIIFASINATAYNTVMVGFTLESDNEEARDLIQQACDVIDLDSALFEATLHCLIFGDAYLEKRKIRKGDITKLSPVDPQTMIIEYDKYGNIKSYQQEIGGRKVGKSIKPEDIIHIRFIPIPGSPYGVSMIEPNIRTIDWLMDIENMLYNAVKRHATSKIVATVGTEKDGQIPPDEVMDAITAKLDDINEINEFVLPWMIKLDTIDEGGMEGITEIYNLFQALVVIGMMCPEEAFGQGKGSTEATSRIKAILFERIIKSYQHRLSIAIKQNLFDEILLDNGFKSENNPDVALPVRMKFNSVTEEDEAMRAKWLGNLLRGFPDGQLPFTRNEIRAFFAMSPREGMDDVPVGKRTEDEEGEQSEEEEKPEEEKPRDEEAPKKKPVGKKPNEEEEENEEV